ncbi:bacterial transferase hexapeptide repeat protein [Actinomyces urogenitalis DSM 15434]|uniref:Bacterial transferase hexapeptide repeat protein n=2 Tax=Actinomyces urogenitalis TaxID=103621 RepID=C0W4N5_9ACTO|nr:sugar O-acetyltransferase [Actinomyces urogenitalis]EEH66308.1 bacterial transferase hexapeptide repeat protein [Actinomyces urogenitalis DSM 15434]MBS5976797.1 sugar O-acetyltransferase [Actinomyces urogenitalis]MDK8835652.1 sugar O-acetyltransferase [Actinomyces urogenitalis]MDU6152199.1 sugar O-acetyltransferase [Actinomyces urogenitalis]MDU7428266.1 sugar O-acetyltransferase [Actinomyces urogenitalis]
MDETTSVGPTAATGAAHEIHNPYVFNETETRRRLDTGELYTDFGPGREALEEERNRGKELVERYNATSIRDPEGRAALARELFASFGDGAWLETPIYCAYGSHTTIGEGCWFNTGTTLIDDAAIHIGKRVLFGPHVTVATAGHPIDPELRSTGAQFSAVVTIEDDVWVGANTTILPGVHIGYGSVIAAGAVVSSNVPPMTVVGGLPARVIRTITPGEETAYKPPRSL